MRIFRAAQARQIPPWRSGQPWAADASDRLFGN